MRWSSTMTRTSISSVGACKLLIVEFDPLACSYHRGCVHQDERNVADHVLDS